MDLKEKKIEKAAERLYLFYRKESMHEFWVRSLLSERILLGFLGITAVGMAVLFAVITTLAADQLYAGVLLSAAWLFMFPGLLYLSRNIEKSFWVSPREAYIIRRGDNWSCRRKRKVFYREAEYIITGNAEPFIVPRRTSSKWYHKRYGDYINVLDKDKKPLFTVRYSEDILKLLEEKCTNARILDIEDYDLDRKMHSVVSAEIKAAEQEIVEQYKGRV